MNGFTAVGKIVIAGHNYKSGFWMLDAGKLDDALIEKSQSWYKISERLSAIIHLDDILDSEFSIYKFDRLVR